MEDVFLLRCLHNGLESFCIWYSDDKDGLFCDESKRILSFSNIKTAVLYLSQKGLTLSSDKDIPTYDFDCLMVWINSNDLTICCVDILNYWNFFADVAYTTGKRFKGDKKNKSINLIYEKLFLGNNLPTIKPEDDENYLPIWETKQISIIKTVMADGLNIFSESIHFEPTR